MSNSEKLVDAEAEPEDARMNRIAEALRNDTDGSFVRFTGLPDRHRSLIIACASLRRIQRLCDAIFGGPWVCVRYPDGSDEYLYQSLRKPFFSNLQKMDECQPILALAHDILPEALPAGEDVSIEWEHGLEPRIYELQSQLMRLAVEEGVNPFDHGGELCFLTYDDNIEFLAERSRKLNEAFAKKHSLPIPESQQLPSRSGPTSAHKLVRSGRNSIKLDYEVASREWWALVLAYEESGESRRPNQADFCTHLTANGIQISPRTLRERIRSWNGSGHSWPPPMPTD